MRKNLEIKLHHTHNTTITCDTDNFTFQKYINCKKCKHMQMHLHGRSKVSKDNKHETNLFGSLLQIIKA